MRLPRLHSWASRALGRRLRRWPTGGGLPVCAWYEHGMVYQGGAAPGAHLALRLALWPLALLDWAVRLPWSLWRFLGLAWRVPNPSVPWPPLP